MKNENNIYNTKEMESLKNISTLPTNDVIFHCLFGTKGNEKITKAFLEKLLNKEVEEIDLDLNLNLIREHYDDKLGILDVRVKDKNGVNYNIEMQNTSSNTLPERIISYWSRLYNGDLKVGNDYNTLNKTIAILIVNDTIKNLEVIKKFHTKWNLREETYTEIILTDYLEIHIIELPKYIQSKKSNNNVWLDFLLKPNEIRGMDVMEDSKMKKEIEMVEEARKKWEEIIADEKIRDRALRLEIARLDYNTGMNNAREEGIKQGIEKGARESLENIVKEMLSKNFQIKTIAEITKLDIKEIEKIKDGLL